MHAVRFNTTLCACCTFQSCIALTGSEFDGETRVYINANYGIGGGSGRVCIKVVIMEVNILMAHAFLF